MAKTRRNRVNRRRTRGAGQGCSRPTCVNNTNRRIRHTTNPINSLFAKLELLSAEQSSSINEMDSLSKQRDSLFNTGENTTNVDRRLAIVQAKLGKVEQQISNVNAIITKRLGNNTQHVNKISKIIGRPFRGLPTVTNEEMRAAGI